MAFKVLEQHEIDMLPEKEKEAYLDCYKDHCARVRFVERLEALDKVKIPHAVPSLKKIHIASAPETADRMKIKAGAEICTENSMCLGKSVMQLSSSLNRKVKQIPVPEVIVRVSGVSALKPSEVGKIPDISIMPLTKIHIPEADVQNINSGNRNDINFKVKISEKIRISKPDDNISFKLGNISSATVSPVKIPVSSDRKILIGKKDIGMIAAKLVNAPSVKNTLQPVKISPVEKIKLPSVPNIKISVPNSRISGVKAEIAPSPVINSINIRDFSGTASVCKIKIPSVSPSAVKPASAAPCSIKAPDFKLKLTVPEVKINCPHPEVMIKNKTADIPKQSLKFHIPKIQAKKTDVFVPDTNSFSIDKEKILKTIR